MPTQLDKKLEEVKIDKSCDVHDSPDLVEPEDEYASREDNNVNNKAKARHLH